MILPVLLAVLQTVLPPNWIVEDERSALDGKRSVWAPAYSTQEIPNAIGSGVNAGLALSCIDNQRRVVLSWPTYVGRDEVRVEWKIGSGPIRDHAFGVLSTTGAVLSGRGADQMLSEMRSEGTLVMRVTAYQSQQEVSFDLTNVNQALDVIDEACPSRRRR